MAILDKCVVCERNLPIDTAVYSAMPTHRIVKSVCPGNHHLYVVAINNLFYVCSCCWESVRLSVVAIPLGKGTSAKKKLFMQRYFSHYYTCSDGCKYSVCPVCLQKITLLSETVTFFPCAHQVCLACKDFGLSTTTCLVCRRRVTAKISTLSED